MSHRFSPVSAPSCVARGAMALTVCVCVRVSIYRVHGVCTPDAFGRKKAKLFKMGQPAVGVCVLCCAKVLDLIAAQSRTRMLCWHISQKCHRCSSRLRAIQGCEYEKNNPGSIHPEPVDAPTSRQQQLDLNRTKQQKCDYFLIQFWTHKAAQGAC